MTTWYCWLAKLVIALLFFNFNFFFLHDFFFEFLGTYILFETKTIFLLINFNVFVLVYLFAILVYFVGLFGVFINLKSVLISLLFVELSYFGLICLLLCHGFFFHFSYSFATALLLILLAASESVVGLGLLIALFTLKGNITYFYLNSLKF